MILECPVCSDKMELRPAIGRKSKKQFIMIICPNDGRHFRGFITDREYVSEFALTQQQNGTLSLWSIVKLLRQRRKENKEFGKDLVVRIKNTVFKKE